MIFSFLGLAETLRDRYAKAEALYRHGYCTKAEAVQALALYTECALGGLVEAQVRVGEMHFFGRQGTRKLLPFAGRFFAQAAASGHVIARYYYAILPASARTDMMQQAEDAPAISVAIRDLEKAALDDAHPDRIEAAYLLGMAFAYDDGCNNGLYVVRPVAFPALNHVTAAQWFLKAAHAGFAPAQYELGNCYMHGRGTQVDRTRSVTWFERAASGTAQATRESSVASGSTNVSVSYEYGPAQIALALSYAQGRGVSRDPQLARYWVTRSLANGMEVEARQWEGLIGDDDPITQNGVLPSSSQRAPSEVITDEHEFVGQNSGFFLPTPAVLQSDPEEPD